MLLSGRFTGLFISVAVTMLLAVALAIAACQAGFSIYFTTLDDLVRNLKEAEASGRFAKKLPDLPQARRPGRG